MVDIHILLLLGFTTCGVSIWLTTRLKLIWFSPGIVVPSLYLLSYFLEPTFAYLGWNIAYPIVFNRFDTAAIRYITGYLFTFTMSFWTSYLFFAKRTVSSLPSPQTCYVEIQQFSPVLLYLCSIVILLITIFARGGVDEFWNASTVRGEGQWDWNATKYVALGADLATPLLVLLAALTFSTRKHLLLVAIPVLLSLPRLSSFSRAGLLYPVLFLIAASLAGYKFRKHNVVLVMVLFTLGILAGLTGRIDHSPGIRNAVQNLVSIDLYQIDYLRLFTGVSRFRAIPPIIALSHHSSPIDGLWEWLKLLMPLPTFLGWYDRSQFNLAQFGGVHGNPFPSIGDMYYLLRETGALLVAVVQGVGFAWLQAKISLPLNLQIKPKWEHVIIYLAAIQGLIISFNNTSRAATRYLIYAFVLILIIKAIYRFRSKILWGLREI